jgi:LacI family transcriptional regulator
MTTLRDIASEAGVSFKTVSNVLNGRNKGVYGAAVQERAERIRAIAARLNYRPNHSARAMRTQRTNIIGLLVWRVADPATGRMVDAFEQALHRHGYRLLLGISGGGKKNDVDYLRQIPAGMMDGLINADSYLDTDTVIDTLRPLPVVTYNRRHPSSPACVDTAREVEIALDHLLGLGHRRIGFVHGPTGFDITRIELAAYKRVMTCHGCPPNPAWTANAQWDQALAEQVTPQLVNAGCTAIMAGNDIYAVGVIRALRRAGLRVPQDISVTGADDVPLAVACDPELTTLRFPYEAMVERHVAAMLALLTGQPPPPPVRLEHELVIRGSTAPPGMK